MEPVNASRFGRLCELGDGRPSDGADSRDGSSATEDVVLHHHAALQYVDQAVLMPFGSAAGVGRVDSEVDCEIRPLYRLGLGGQA